MENKLDIIIPVYNEGKNIINTIESLRLNVKTPFRVLICYDNDNDDTLIALADYKENVNIEYARNAGKGAHGAIMTGFRDSTAPAVIVFPADDTFNAGILDKMYQKFEAGADIVAASRFMKGGSMTGCPLLKSILVRTASFTLYWFASIPIKDASNGFRLFSRRVIDEIEIESTTGFTYSLELLVKCHRLGWNIDETPALWNERTEGKSRFKVIKWLPHYLRWYFYGFMTTWLRISHASVKRKPSKKNVSL